MPLFILAGNFLNNSGITENLLKLAAVLTGRMHGGLAQTSIALSTLMSGVTGSSHRRRRDERAHARRRRCSSAASRKGYAAGVLSYGSLLAPIIPPGIGFILYGTVGQVSIGRLFAAGIIPGLLLWAALAIAISITARGAATSRSATSAPTVEGDRARLLGRHLGDPVSRSSCCSGLRFGIFTPSEIGAFAVVYAVAIGFFAYRMLDAARASARRSRAAWSTSAPSCSCSRCRRSSATASCSSACPRSISGWMLGITDNANVVMVLIVAVHPAGRHASWKARC